MILAFIGDNGPAREKAASAFIKAFISQHSSTAVDKFSGDELEITQLVDAISTTPFLSDKRLVVIRDLSVSKNSGRQNRFYLSKNCRHYRFGNN